MANEKVNKVVLGNETLIDLTGDTVSANNLLAGATAHDASGNQVTGNVTVPTALADLTDDATHRLVTDTEKSTWNAKPSTTDVNNKHKVTTKQVDLTNWSADTTSQSGTTLYKKSISLAHVYVSSPSVDIGASGVLPTSAEQESYNLLQYVTVDSAVPCLYIYASDIPTTAFYINVEGVD